MERDLFENITAENISYRTESKELSNSTMINTSVFEDVELLFSQYVDNPAKHFLSLAVLTESIVLSETIIPVSKDFIVDNIDGLSSDYVGFYNQLLDNNIINPKGNINQLFACALSHSAVAYIENQQKDNIPDLVSLIAKNTATPYCKDSFYTRGVMDSDAINISSTLYRYLEDWHKDKMDIIKAHLGPKYFRLPCLFAIILKRCDGHYDIVDKMLEARFEFEDFRNHCTNMEVELRNSKSLKEQYSIIDHIEASYTNISNKFESNSKNQFRLKKRLIYGVFDIVKSGNPLKMAAGIADGAIELDLEKDGLNLIPSYYDLWNFSTDVEQGFSSIERIFGTKAANKFSEQAKHLKF